MPIHPSVWWIIIVVVIIAIIFAILRRRSRQRAYLANLRNQRNTLPNGVHVIRTGDNAPCSTNTTVAYTNDYSIAIAIPNNSSGSPYYGGQYVAAPPPAYHREETSTSVADTSPPAYKDHGNDVRIIPQQP